ncbi:MAG: hypothetical protein HY966_03610 [Ignavibacteriales bacterium]|nr:hypothetical protein [Ignavibacteriales bacterium]
MILDAPHRVEPGKPIPLLLLAKDADRFSCILHHVSVTVKSNAIHPTTHDLLKEPITIDAKFFSKVFQLERPQTEGWVECDTEFEIEIHGRRRTYRNDNYRTSSHRPLKIFLAATPLPALPGLHLGDAHLHSSFTDDQVEFGAPLKPSVELARSMGLSFFCVTDHSYDLDDRTDGFLHNDPALPKWRELQNQIDALNEANPNFAVIRGEEVSCRNAFGHNVHFLLYGHRNFIPGSGDSAERWFKTWSEHSIAEILANNVDGTAAYASHALEPISFLQRLFLDRSTWTDSDLALHGLTGMQFANGKRETGFRRGYEAWVKFLLKGKKLFTLAGTDAHGNFNRYRQILIPFFKIQESHDQLFGKMQTGIFCSQLTETAVVQSLLTGAAIATDGPVINLRVRNDSNPTSIGKTFRSDSAATRSVAIDLSVRSTPEFGGLATVQVFYGVLGAPSESLLAEFSEAQEFALNKIIQLHIDAISYVRAEIHTSPAGTRDSTSHFCFSNPIWFVPRA